MDEGLAHAVLVGADAADQIAEALHQHAAGQHVAEGGDVLSVAVGLVEGGGEAVGHQQGEVGVLAAQLGIGIGVAVDGVDALHVLGHYVAVGVHAEGAHLVAVLLGTVDQLGLVHHVGDVLEHLGGQLHPHADVHLVVDELDAQLLALVGEPLRAGAAGSGDEPGTVHLVPLVGDEAVALLPQVLNFGDGGAEPELDALAHLLIDALENFEVVLGAQVLAPGLEQMEVILQCLLLQGLGGGGLGGEHLVGGPVPHVDGVHVVDELHDLPLGHEVGEPAAEGGGEIVLAVGEGARPAEAAHGVTHLAVDALLHLARHDGAAPGIDVGPLIQGDHLEARVAVHQLIAREDAGLAAADDGNVIACVHVRSLTLQQIRDRAVRSVPIWYYNKGRAGLQCGFPEKSRRGRQIRPRPAVLLMWPQTTKGGSGMTEAEFLPLFDQYRPMVYGLALSYTRSPQDAEDVCQEVFLTLLEKPPAPGKERPWLARVAVNRCRDLLTSPWRRRRENDDTALERLTFETPEEAGLFAALGALSPDSRALLHLRYYEGFTVAELARQFRTTAPALSARLYRAKQQLRKKLEELGYEEALSEDF